MDKNIIMKGIIEELLAKAKNAHRDFKITTLTGVTQTIAGHAVMDQQISITDVALTWTDGTRTFLVPFYSIDHVVMV
jgi:hypothetical protein